MTDEYVLKTFEIIKAQIATLLVILSDKGLTTTDEFLRLYTDIVEETAKINAEELIEQLE